MEKQKTILVVDDSLTTLFLIKKMLEKRGYNIIQAKTGQESLDIVKKQTPDLVLLDIMLPDIPGDTVFFQLKESYPKIKVILISSLALSERTIDDLIGAGLVGFMRKPLTEEELLKKLNSVI